MAMNIHFSRGEKMKTEKILNDFLQTLGDKRDKIRMDPGNLREPEPSERKTLISNLEVAARSVRFICWVWVGLTIAISSVIIGLTVYYREEINSVISLLSNSGLLALAFSQIEKVHRRQLAAEILLISLPNLASKDWARLVKTILEEFLKERNTEEADH